MKIVGELGREIPPQKTQFPTLFPQYFKMKDLASPDWPTAIGYLIPLIKTESALNCKHHWPPALYVRFEKESNGETVESIPHQPARLDKLLCSKVTEKISPSGGSVGDSEHEANSITAINVM